MVRIGFFWLLLCLPFGVYAADLNEELFAAARKGDIEAVKVVLQKGVDVNAKTRYGATALHYACDRGHLEVVRFLIERGADVNARAEIDCNGMGGQTPIFHALTNHNALNSELGQFLIACDADLDIRARVPGHYELPGEILDVSVAEYAALYPLR